MSRLLTNHDDDDIHLDEHVVDVDDQAHPMMPLTVDDGGLAANKKKTSWIRDPRTIAIVVLSTLLLVAVVAYGRAATLGHDDPASHDENTSEQVSETNWQPMVESQSIITRLEHLEYIAALNSGSRSVNTGLNMSSAYVAEELRLYTDFVVYEEHFRLAVPTEQFPAQFTSVLPTFVNYTHGTDFYPLSFEGAGDVQGNLTLMPQGLTGESGQHRFSLSHFLLFSFLFHNSQVAMHRTTHPSSIQTLSAPSCCSSEEAALSMKRRILQSIYLMLLVSSSTTVMIPPQVSQ